MIKEFVTAESEAIVAKAIETLHARLSGLLLRPGDEQYQEASQAWNLQAEQHPALVVMAQRVEDIIASVEFARDTNTGIGVMATGHGVGVPCDGGLLINTSEMRAVKIDPVSQTATVEAGALWKDVIPGAYAHGLAALLGSSSNVGVVGYTLGGGFGYLGRKYGLNVAGVTAADIVTSDGKLLRASEKENADLFWGLKGSVGNLGVVTSLEFKLYPLKKVYGGAVFYPVENAREVLSVFSRWTTTLPDEITTGFTFMNFPPLPAVPEPLRGRSVVVIKGCYCGEKPERGEELFKPVRRELGQPIMDTFEVIPVEAMDVISKDPVDPMGFLQYSAQLSDLSDQAIDALIKVAGAGSGSPVSLVEMRLLGGALQRDPKNIKLMGNRNARFSLNVLGAIVKPEIADAVSTHLSRIADVTKPYQTGENFINFVETAPAPDRVRAAYTAEDWKRLVELKKKYDPKNIFRFNRNIPPQ
jgi:UDP-N-acetylenolpyruvoylglucosamine reductase